MNNFTKKLALAALVVFAFTTSYSFAVEFLATAGASSKKCKWVDHAGPCHFQWDEFTNRQLCMPSGYQYHSHLAESCGHYHPGNLCTIKKDGTCGMEQFGVLCS